MTDNNDHVRGKGHLLLLSFVQMMMQKWILNKTKSTSSFLDYKVINNQFIWLINNKIIYNQVFQNSVVGVANCPTSNPRPLGSNFWVNIIVIIDKDTKSLIQASWSIGKIIKAMFYFFFF